MANTRSAQKRNRQALKRRARNTSVMSSVKSAIKKARAAVTTGDAKNAEEAVKAATRAIDKAATKGVLHARNASRRVARLAQSLTKKKSAAAAK